MTIEQTITVPADHRVFLEFQAPNEIPAGPVRIELKLTPVTEGQGKSKLVNSKDTVTPLTDALSGILSDWGDIDLDEVRAQRLAKYLK